MQPRFRHPALEVRDEAIEHPEILLGERISGTPVRCAETKFQVGTRRDIAVPAGRDVPVRALHDDEQLALPQTVDQVVGLSDVTDDREVVAVVIEQHGVVRRDESVGVLLTSVAQGFRSTRRRSSATSVIAKLGFWRMRPSLRERHAWHCGHQ